MKAVIRKTKEEREKVETFTEVRVKNTPYYFWVCDDCNIAYFGEDIILKSSKGRYSYICPNLVHRDFIGKIFHKNKVVCGNSISGGDEECFNEYYKFRNPTK